MSLSSRPEYAVLGQIIAQARTDLGLTQRALARKLGRAETSIHKIETGVQRVDLIELADIAEALKLPLAELIAKFESRINAA